MRSSSSGKLAAAAVFASTLPAGCESVIPRRDLQLLAATLPPAPEIPQEEVATFAVRIREQTGVSDFEFSDSNFEPEMKLPQGTAWILGLFLGDQKEYAE